MDYMQHCIVENVISRFWCLKRILNLLCGQPMLIRLEFTRDITIRDRSRQQKNLRTISSDFAKIMVSASIAHSIKSMQRQARSPGLTQSNSSSFAVQLLFPVKRLIRISSSKTGCAMVLF